MRLSSAFTTRCYTQRQCTHILLSSTHLHTGAHDSLCDAYALLLDQGPCRRQGPSHDRHQPPTAHHYGRRLPCSLGSLLMAPAEVLWTVYFASEEFYSAVLLSPHLLFVADLSDWVSLVYSINVLLVFIQTLGCTRDSPRESTMIEYLASHLIGTQVSVVLIS